MVKTDSLGAVVEAKRESMVWTFSYTIRTFHIAQNLNYLHSEKDVSGQMSYAIVSQKVHLLPERQGELYQVEHHI